MHYQRVIYRGSPDQPLSQAPDDVRFWAKVKTGAADECWLWQADVVPRTGYGRYWLDGRAIPAHRAAYIFGVGPIPAELHIDHLCRNRLCQNPAHLEAVTQRENNLRSTSPAALNSVKTHCKNGHEFTPENTYEPPKRPGNRHCRTCRSESSDRYLKRKGAASGMPRP